MTTRSDRVSINGLIGHSSFVEISLCEECAVAKDQWCKTCDDSPLELCSLCQGKVNAIPQGSYILVDQNAPRLLYDEGDESEYDWKAAGPDDD